MTSTQCSTIERLGAIVHKVFYVSKELIIIEGSLGVRALDGVIVDIYVALSLCLLELEGQDRDVTVLGTRAEFHTCDTVPCM